MNALFMLILFTTSHCHLCELAYDLVSQQCDGSELQCIEIIHDEKLLKAYELRIPVLQRTDTLAELSWPFGADDIRRFLKA
jgi:hypothetical protein